MLRLGAWARVCGPVQLLVAAAILWQAAGLSCWEGCVGTLCKADAGQGLPQGRPQLVANVDANRPPSELPVQCYSLCEPLGASVFGFGSKANLELLGFVSSSTAAANGVDMKVCETSGCNDPAALNCPLVSNSSALQKYLPNRRAIDIGQCTSIAGLTLQDSAAVCQFTPIGVSCPPNYYCPPYSVQHIFMYRSVLDAASCSYGLPVVQITGNLSFAVMCPCTPGFLCPGNVAIPTFCPAGHYCPPDPVISHTPLGEVISPQTGLGAFGSLVHLCPEDTWCSEGLVVPFTCDLKLQNCPPGTQHPSTWKLAFVILLLLAVVYIPLRLRFLRSRLVRTNRRRLWEEEREELKNRLRDNFRENSLAGSLGHASTAGLSPEALALLGSKKTTRELRISLGVGMAPAQHQLPHQATTGESHTFSLSVSAADEIPNPIRASGRPTLSGGSERLTEMRERGASQASSTSGGGGKFSSAAVAPAPIGADPSNGTGVNISFEDVDFRAPNGKTVMYRVSGEFRSGRMCAIMGPSGAGKSTIISLITGRARRSGGSVRVNGVEVLGLSEHPDCRGRVGFVPQEDVMLRDLSAQENIAFSARYRLPATLSKAEVDQRVNECIDVLELEKIKDEAVGDERTRGISGGQRKRVNVGIELVTDPKVLFLDEPTSGKFSAFN